MSRRVGRSQRGKVHRIGLVQVTHRRCTHPVTATLVPAEILREFNDGRQALVLYVSKFNMRERTLRAESKYSH